jgi:hypothetical protein
VWRVEAPPEAYGEVFAAARAAGVRLGWLDLAATVAMPTDLDTAAAAGVLRAVAVGSGRTVAVKPLAGAPVLRDLLREHFLGCGAVLVRGEVEGELLAPAPSGWRVGEGEAVGAEALLRGLRSCGTTERRQALSGGAGHRG